MVVLLVTVALAECDRPSTLVEFATANQRGEVAFAAMDASSLATARDEAARALQCLAEPVGSRDAAAFHRLMAFVAFTEHDFPEVLAEFHAARRLEPGYAVPEDVAPAGHPLLALYAQAESADEGQLQPVQAVGGGFMVVDGVRGAPRPTGVSAILQRFGTTGAVEAATWLRAGEPLPAWAVPPRAVSRKGLHAGLIGATGGAAVASGILYALALSAHDDFWDTDDPVSDSELPAVAERANTLSYASIGVGAVAVGLGAVTVVTW